MPDKGLRVDLLGRKAVPYVWLRPILGSGPIRAVYVPRIFLFLCHIPFYARPYNSGMTSVLRIALGVAVVAAVFGCSNDQTAASTAGATTTTSDSTTGATPVDATTTGTTGADTQMSSPSPLKPTQTTTPPKAGDDVAVIDTNYGRIVFKFFPEKAPNTVENFKKLANKKFYDGTKFHRVIPGFMIQGGDPNSKGSDRSSYGTGGPGYTIKAEFNDIPHERGIVSMARSSDPNSAGSQFFIVVASSSFLNGQYTAFGSVLQGMDVADKIVNLPRDEKDDPNPGNEAVMKSVRIEKWPLKS